MKKTRELVIGIVAFVIAGCNNHAGNKTGEDSTKTNTGSSSEDIAANPLKNCYFGDLHLHTSLSADANFFGTTSLPEDSYKYAMGEEVTYMGQKTKRNAPLDFLAVTDHSEYLGVVAALKDPNGPFVGTDLYKFYTS